MHRTPRLASCWLNARRTAHAGRTEPGRGTPGSLAGWLAGPDLATCRCRVWTTASRMGRRRARTTHGQGGNRHGRRTLQGDGRRRTTDRGGVGHGPNSTHPPVGADSRTAHRLAGLCKDKQVQAFVWQVFVDQNILLLLRATSQEPDQIPVLEAWSFAMSCTSFLNSTKPCPECEASLLTAISTPSGNWPL